MGAAEWLAVASGAFWWVSAYASWRKARRAFETLGGEGSIVQVLCSVRDLRRVSLGLPAKNPEHFAFRSDKPELPSINAALDAYTALMNAVAALFAFAASAAFGLAAAGESDSPERDGTYESWR